MSASHFPARSAIAFQLAATLDAYEENVDALVHAPLDLELYQRVSRQVDDMRLYAAALPPLAVPWVEVMIRHFELAHGIWRAQQPGATPADLAQLRAQLIDAVERLARRCVALMPEA